MTNRKAIKTLSALLSGGVAFSPAASGLIIPPAIETAQPDYNITRATNLVDKLSKMESSDSYQVTENAKASAKAMINDYIARLQHEDALAISAAQKEWSVPADKCYHIVILYRIAQRKYGDFMNSPIKVGFAELRNMYFDCPMTHKFG